VIALCMTAESRFVNTYCEFVESGCLGVQPKVGGKFLLKLNNGERWRAPLVQLLGGTGDG